MNHMAVVNGMLEADIACFPGTSKINLIYGFGSNFIQHIIKKANTFFLFSIILQPW